MKKIEITVEIVKRLSRTLEVSDDDYALLLDGDCTLIEQCGLIKETENDPDYEMDYTVYDIESDKQVIDWS